LSNQVADGAGKLAGIGAESLLVFLSQQRLDEVF
jgi:hypothetical protein